MSLRFVRVSQNLFSFEYVTHLFFFLICDSMPFKFSSINKSSEMLCSMTQPFIRGTQKNWTQPAFQRFARSVTAKSDEK